MKDCPYRTHPPNGESIQCIPRREAQEKERDNGKPGLVVHAPCAMYDMPDRCIHYQREEAKRLKDVITKVEDVLKDIQKHYSIIKLIYYSGYANASIDRILKFLEGKV